MPVRDRLFFCAMVTDAPHLTLYVAGDTPRSRQAVANLERLCSELLAGRARCDTVDILDNPEVADSERILTTPTLVRESPSPRRRVTGDLSDAPRVLAALGLASGPSPSPSDR